MSAFVQQLPALPGVLVGATATYTATAAAERARWRRAQAVRWDDKRLNAYTDYAHAVKKSIPITVRLAAYHGIHPDIDALAPEEGQRAPAEAEEERTIKREAVLLLGTEQIVEAARAWHESAFRMQRIVAGAETDMTWAEAVRAASLTRRGFCSVARKDIGIGSGEAPENYEWQLSRLLPADDPKS